MLRLHQNPGGFPLIGFEGFGIIFTVLGFVKEKICSKKIWHFFRRTASENLSCTTCHTLKQVKQNATNNLAPFFRSAFNALSDGVLQFAHCVAP